MYYADVHYPITDDNSSVVPKASNIWSSFGRLSPVKVLEKPNEVLKEMLTQIWHDQDEHLRF